LFLYTGPAKFLVYRREKLDQFFLALLGLESLIGITTDVLVLFRVQPLVEVSHLDIG